MSHYAAFPCNPEDLDTKKQIHAGQWGTALGRAEESTIPAVLSYLLLIGFQAPDPFPAQEPKQHTLIKQ